MSQGLRVASAFSAIRVYAQELLPSRTSIGYAYKVGAFLPMLGLLTALLPDLRMAGAHR